jgi:hypothetical protein
MLVPGRVEPGGPDGGTTPPPLKIKVNPKKIILPKNASVQVAAGGTFTWVSQDPGVATVMGSMGNVIVIGSGCHIYSR